MNQQLLQKNLACLLIKIACVSHMLMDERVIPFLVKAEEMFSASKRPAGLYHQKASGSSRTSTLYIKAFTQHRTWQKETSIHSLKGPLLMI
jgi:hypothetical protein